MFKPDPDVPQDSLTDTPSAVAGKLTCIVVPELVKESFSTAHPLATQEVPFTEGTRPVLHDAVHAVVVSQVLTIVYAALSTLGAGVPGHAVALLLPEKAAHLFGEHPGFDLDPLKV